MAEVLLSEQACSSDESGREDCLQRNPKYASSFTSRSSSDLDTGAAAYEEKNGDFSHRDDRNTKPPHSRMDPGSEQRRSNDELEYARQTNMLNIQSAMAAQDALLLRAGYDMRPYYGWLPGIAPLRLPAFIYPQTAFFGFTPPSSDAARSKEQQTNGGSKSNSNRDGSEKRDENKDDSRTNVVGDGHKSCEAEKARTGNNTFQREASTKSDVDEGLELDGHDTKNVPKKLVRKGSLGGQSGQSQTHTHTHAHTRTQMRVTSVIRENCTAEQKPTENNASSVDDECDEIDHEAKRGTTKRGRASTRRIEKTEQYWDRRKKNNVSAKKSRDARRQREMITNQRSSMLETENLRLRAEVATLREKNERLKKELSKVSSV